MSPTFKRGLAALLISAALSLSGCVTVEPITDEALAQKVSEVSTYESDHSFAWNIAKQMGIDKYVKDAYLEEADYVKFKEAGGDGFGAKVGWYAGASFLTGNPFAASSLLFLFTPTADDFMERPVYLGFLPIDTAKDEPTAFNSFLNDILLNAYGKTAAEMGCPSTPERVYLGYEYRCPNDGVIAIGVAGGPDLNMRYAHQTLIPNWIPHKGNEKVWAVGQAPSARIITTERFRAEVSGSMWSIAQNRRSKIELMERFVKHLPDNVYVFVPSFYDENGDHTPAYIADNKRKYFFVMPKSAEKTK